MWTLCKPPSVCFFVLTWAKPFSSVHCWNVNVFPVLVIDVHLALLKCLKDGLLFAFQSPLSPSRPLSWPPWGPPTCGSNSTPTPSMAMGPSWPGRWNTVPPAGAGATGSQWTPRATRSGISTRTQSMRSACFSPGQGRVAPVLPGPLSEPEPSVLVSPGVLGPLVSVFWVLTCNLRAGGSHFPQLCWDPVWVQKVPSPVDSNPIACGLQTSRLGISQEASAPFSSVLNLHLPRSIT